MSGRGVWPTIVGGSLDGQPAPLAALNTWPAVVLSDTAETYEVQSFRVGTRRIDVLAIAGVDRFAVLDRLGDALVEMCAGAVRA